MIVKVSMQQGAAIISSPEGPLLHASPSGPLLARMRGRQLAYFHAVIWSHEIELGDEAPAQVW